MTGRTPYCGDGERVDHRYRNDLFYAHLSLYAFAARWAAGARVLDVGCGTGYGSAYLRRHGAGAVTGLDLDSSAVRAATEQFAGDGVGFAVADAGALPTAAAAYGVIVALNALEHVRDVRGFLRRACDALAPGGTLIAAVPPVTSPEQRLAELANPYHLHIWTPQQWRLMVAPFFAEVQVFRHDVAAKGAVPDFRNTPEQTRMRESDFAFRPLTGSAQLRGSLSVVLVASGPLAPDVRPSADRPVRLVGGSLSRDRPPRLVPLAPDELAAPLRPAGELPSALLRAAADGGLAGMARSVRSWAAWRMRRALALRELRRG